MHPTRRSCNWLVASLVPVCLVAVSHERVVLAGQVVLGVMGDSLSDEYEEASYGLYAENWVEQLSSYASVDVGPTATEASQPGGTWGEPRREGFEYNWARSGATTGSLLSGGQHTGLASQVPTEGITHAVMFIGANDFFPTDTAYTNIYNGTWSQATIDSYVAGRITNVTTALNTVLPTGVKTVLGNFPDYGIAPITKLLFPDPVQRQLVTDVLADLNSQLDTLAQIKQIPIVDVFGTAQAIFGTHTSPNSMLSIGNVDILLSQNDTAAGGNPTAGFVHDGIHINTPLQGLLANVFMEALNLGYDAGLTLFTEEEILSHRGIAYGGSDTLEAQFGLFSDYVTNYAPPILFGDISMDNEVDIGDFVLWANAFGHTGACEVEDLSHDGEVDIGDFVLWANNFGNTVGPSGATGSSSTSVPEPSSLILLGLGGVALFGPHRAPATHGLEFV